MPARSIRVPSTPQPASGGKFFRWITLCSVCLNVVSAWADDVDDIVAARLKDRHIPGLSLAVVEEGKIVRAQGYGFTDKSGQTPVTPETLFQAGSISKPVAAFAALHLVQDGKLSLDADVNTELRTWKVPDNTFTKDNQESHVAPNSEAIRPGCHSMDFPGIRLTNQYSNTVGRAGWHRTGQYKGYSGRFCAG